ncbi:MAG: hypothetical protein FK732_05200 [Asgard group archaeon]|nr:hypothetical protein [Asgard group archaeon]
MNEELEKKEEKKVFNKYIQRLLDPIVMFCILFWIYSFNMLVFFFRTPIIVSTDLVADTITRFFWNGNYSIFDIEFETITEGYDASFPSGLSWLFIIATIFFLVITTIGIVLSLVKEETKRFQITQLLIWPLFIISSMIISCAVVFINWGVNQITDDIRISFGRVIMLDLIVSILLVLFILILSVYFSAYKRNKRKLAVSYNST